jgi:DNA-binding MarR family transcriptional regulator
MCALMGTAKLIRRFAEARMSQRGLPATLSGPRMGVLFHVRKSGGLRMGDLAARLDVAPRTVTDLVAGLERDGLLVRKPDRADRRATRLELTAAAQADFDRFQGVRGSFIEEIFSPLNAADRRRLADLLSRLAQGPIRQTGAAHDEGIPGAPDDRCR